MNQVRARVDAIVNDPRRPLRCSSLGTGSSVNGRVSTMSTCRLSTGRTSRWWTRGKGVEALTEHAAIVNGKRYEVDCLIFATGFEVGTSYTRRAGYDIVGRGGRDAVGTLVRTGCARCMG